MHQLATPELHPIGNRPQRLAEQNHPLRSHAAPTVAYSDPVVLTSKRGGI